MKISASKLLKHVERAALGGLVDELVLDKELKFSVTDQSKSVCAICLKGLATNDVEEIGIFNLALFAKAVAYARDTIFAADEIDMQVVDNRLVFKKGGDEFKFLLSDPRVIGSTIDNANQVLDYFREKEGVDITLTPSVVQKCLKALGLIEADICSIVVQSGQVHLKVGKIVDHNTVLSLGTTKLNKNFTILFKPEFIIKVLSILPESGNSILELRMEMPAIIDSTDYIFLISPVNAGTN